MKTTIKNWINDVIRIYNMGSPSGRRQELELQIEEADVNYRLHSLGNDDCIHRKRLHELQFQYMKRYSEYYHYGSYEIYRRHKEQGRLIHRGVRA
jgi:hypothetical protein